MNKFNYTTQMNNEILESFMLSQFNCCWKITYRFCGEDTCRTCLDKQTNFMFWPLFANSSYNFMALRFVLRPFALGISTVIVPWAKFF